MKAPCVADPATWDRTDTDGIEAARKACESCPIKDDCLADTMKAEAGKSRTHRYGVAGGLTPEQRAVLDGRPARKVAARKVAQCGTPSGYNAHRRNREPACTPCLDAHAEAARGRYWERDETTMKTGVAA